MKNKIFTITKEHIAILKHLNIRWDNSCYEGAPHVDIKRPYGNSSGVTMDIAEIIGIKPIENDHDEIIYPKGTRDKCIKLHQEMEIVLQIVLQNLSFDTITYELKDYSDWVPMKGQLLNIEV